MAIGRVVGLIVVATGLVGVLSPHALERIASGVLTPLGLGAAAAFRIGVGILLLWLASASRAPRLLRVLGLVAIAAGVATFLMGVDRARAVLAWWGALGPVAMRLLPGLALLFGVLIVVALSLRGPERPGLPSGGGRED